MHMKKVNMIFFSKQAGMEKNLAYSINKEITFLIALCHTYWTLYTVSFTFVEYFGIDAF